MKDKPSFPARLAGWEYQYERAEKLQQQNADLVAALENSNVSIDQLVIRLKHENWWGGSILARHIGDVILANVEALAQVGE